MSDIQQDGVCLIYKGIRFRITGTVKYFVADRHDLPERLLHRYVWHCEVGPIEPGMHIHHKDECKTNNDISNLEKIESAKHSRGHMIARFATDDRIAFESGLVKAREAAKVWHASEEGLEWHKEHGKKSWIGREYFDAVCQLCGSLYKTPVPDKSRFCSRACITKNANSRQKGKKRIKKKSA